MKIKESQSILGMIGFSFSICYIKCVTFQAKLGRTTVISTSHVSVARIADTIVVLHNGEIIEQGSPKELMMSGGAFRYLAALQVS